MVERGMIAILLAAITAQASAQENWAGTEVPEGTYTILDGGRIIYERKEELIGNEWIEARCNNGVPSFPCDRAEANAAVALVPISNFARSSQFTDLNREVRLISDSFLIINASYENIKLNVEENSNYLNTNRSNIDQNRKDIAINSTAIQTQSTQIADNQNAIVNNSAQIARNIQDIDMLQQSMVGLDTRVTGLENQVGENRTGIAIAMAMSGGVGLQPGETFRMNANWGTWDGDNAFAVSGTYRASRRFMINAAAGSGAEDGEFGGRAGLSFGW